MSEATTSCFRSRTSRCRFGGVRAISDVSFDIRKGEIRAIIGPNGAGKTSMLNVINGFYHPQEGRITYRGRTRARMKPHEAAEQRHRPHLPERRPVQGHDDARQHHDRTQPADDSAVSSGRRCATARRSPRRSSTAASARRSSIFSRSSTSARRRSAPCPTACRSASNSAGRWRWSPSCCCSTSRWRA